MSFRIATNPNMSSCFGLRVGIALLLLIYNCCMMFFSLIANFDCKFKLSNKGKINEYQVLLHKLTNVIHQRLSSASFPTK